MIGLINQRRPRSACCRKSSLIKVYTNCLSIATFTCLSCKASECKRLKRCRHCERVRVCGDGGGGGGAIIQKRVCCLFDVRCHQHCSNKWQYIHTVYLFRERAKSIRWSVIYTCTVPCSHNETSICMFLEYTFDDILTTVYTSESEISTGWSQ